MNARLALTDQAEDLISVFTDELVAAGLTPWPSVVSGARGFCARYPTPAAFCAASVDEQLELRNHQRRFACWLMVTARMPVSAEYLARADLRLGAISARHYPDLRAKFADVAGMLGSDEVWVRAQWSALAQLAAMHGVRPQDVGADQLNTGGGELLTAFAHPNHPKAGHVLRSSLVRLRATLFHAGITDTRPGSTGRRPDRSAPPSGPPSHRRWLRLPTVTSPRSSSACGPQASASPSRHCASSPPS